MNSIVWTISASDPSSRTGIQADLLTINDLAGEPCSVISAITMRDVGVYEAISDNIFTEQLDRLASTAPAKVIKIGLLANIEQVQILSEKLDFYKRTWSVHPFVIYDPVAIVESDINIVEPGIIAQIKNQLLPLVDLLILNAREVFVLSGHALLSGESFQPAAQTLISFGCKSVLIKGGDFEVIDNVSIDYWTDGQREIALTSERIENTACLGLGAILASAMAAVIAQNYFIEDAFVIAKAYVNQRLEAILKNDNSNSVNIGWPTSSTYFPEVVFPESKVGYEFDLQGSLEMGSEFPSCDTAELGLYPVLATVDWLEKILALGVKTVQLRIKDKSSNDVEKQVIDAIALGRKHNARLFINDYWQLAIKHGAYGVHLGQEDIQIADLAMIADAGLRLGISTHGYFELLTAKQLKPSYIALGHIFETQTKDMPSEPQGVERLQKYVVLLDGIPSVAIGGINIQRAEQVCATGVGSIAVVSAITKADDPKLVINSFRQIMNKTKQNKTKL
jgi:hydroxymethylpyrimidine kinase/phosphomethylpyrimidine kinase/thiamine-phosphate diphosphorylase